MKYKILLRMRKLNWLLKLVNESYLRKKKMWNWRSEKKFLLLKKMILQDKILGALDHCVIHGLAGRDQGQNSKDVVVQYGGIANLKTDGRRRVVVDHLPLSMSAAIGDFSSRIASVMIGLIDSGDVLPEEAYWFGWSCMVTW